MKTDIVTTNLRIPRDELIRIRILAAETGMSTNEFIRQTLNGLSKRMGLGVKAEKSEKISIWDLVRIMENTENYGNKYELSKEDQNIYEI